MDDSVAKASGLPPDDAQRALEIFKAAGLVLTLIETAEQLPENGKRKVQAEGVDGVRGMYCPATDTTHLVRENIVSMDEALFVGLHEAFHRGLRKTFGAKVQPILDLLHDGNERIRTLTAHYMTQHNIGRTEAIEEVLADMAGQGFAGDLKAWEMLLPQLHDALEHGADATKLGISSPHVMELVAGVRRAGMCDTP